MKFLSYIHKEPPAFMRMSGVLHADKEGSTIYETNVSPEPVILQQSK
jgi:hypothetical protein